MSNSTQAEQGEYIAPGRKPTQSQAAWVAQGFWKTAYTREKAVIILGIIYALSPIDLIPEVVLGPLGLLDDGGAIFVVLLTILGVLRRQQRSGAPKTLPR